jgi:uncharacterized protein
MTPVYQILADSQDITKKIADRLLSLVITDEAGIKSDTVEIRLDDRDDALELPRTGAELDISIGYKEIGLLKIGLYVVDEISLSGPVRSMVIRGKAANMPKAIKAPKTRPWDDMTIAGMVSSIAVEHGLAPRVGFDLAGLVLPHIDQTEESDLHLLTRMARQYDAVAKPAGSFFLFVKRGQVRSATGKKIPEVQLQPKDVTSWQVTLAERGKYGAVTAEWHDKTTAQRETVKAGDGAPVFKLRRSYPDATQAQAAAEAKLISLDRGTGTLEITLPGNQSLMAEGTLNLSRFRSGIDGRWLLNRVTHTIGSQGFSTSLSAESLK